MWLKADLPAAKGFDAKYVLWILIQTHLPAHLTNTSKGNFTYIKFMDVKLAMNALLQ